MKLRCHFIIFVNCSMSNKVLLIATLIFLVIFVEGWIEQTPGENDIKERPEDEFDDFLVEKLQNAMYLYDQDENRNEVKSLECCKLLCCNNAHN